LDFQDVLNICRDSAFSSADMGTKFEGYIARFLRTYPVTASKLEWVKPWRDFFGRKTLGGHDTGIDLVAKTKTGEYWAIQCKCYEEKHKVSKKDVDTFISASGRKFKDLDGKEVSFSQMFLIATTFEWSEHALDAVKNQIIPLNLIGLDKLMDAPVSWEAIVNGVEGKGARKTKHTLREPDQKEAFDKAIEHFRQNDRGQMIMACGTGKTFTSLKVAERVSKENKNGCVLFLAPSIALVGQTLIEWTAHSENDLNTICVCSDTKVSKKTTEDDLGERVEDLGAPATTDPEKIISQYKAGEGLTVIFSTYQSIDAIIEAQKLGLPKFDIVVCDEAHRTTGAIIDNQDESSFTKVHSDDNIKTKLRLYMTATPRIYGVKGKEDAKKVSAVLCSMEDDSALYGKVFYKIGFGQAVSLGLLSDYKVLILTVKDTEIPDIVKRHWTDGDKEIDADTSCKIWGCMNALAKRIAFDETIENTDPGKMRSGIAFCRTIARSKSIAKRFNEMAQSPSRPIDLSAKHVDGGMDSMDRHHRLNWLKESSDECRILTNARCLSEGVDVPALDAIMFMDSKGSLIDIVQSVGRVMRKPKNSTKKCGYIIVPIVVPESEDPEAALDENERYQVVWQVLRALRSHDERINAEINTLQYNKGKDRRVFVSSISDEYSKIVGLIDGQYTLDDFGNALMARLVLKVGDREYIENWARDIAKIMPNLMDRLKQICEHTDQGYKQYRPAFKRYLKGLKDCVNDDVTDNDAINMLAQQIVTKPIFNALFGNDTFVKQNSVSQTIDAMLDEIDAKNGLKDINLEDFYQSVERTLSKIDDADGKQRVITSLYEKFFKHAFPKDQAINGVVYTPQEVVDFILKSAAGVLKHEFNIEISEKNVNILDPFTGTGTFIARLMELGIISKDNLERKYKKELFANEITLLAYYIAAVNIENTFRRLRGNDEYVSFDHIMLTDTFNIDDICKGHQATLIDDVFFKKNIGNIKEEYDTPITVIIGNPPYGGRQNTANDDAKKRKYRLGIDERIEKTYLDESLFNGKKGNVNSVYDNYVRAFRWSTDRIGDKDGVIAFVTPNGWLTGSAYTGFRKYIEREFSKIYVLDLRGDQNSSNWREEGEKIFGEGSKIGISITLLVKRKGFKGKARVFYAKTADRMKRKEKLDMLKDYCSFTEMEKEKLLSTLSTKENGDWIIKRNDYFQTLIPIAGDTHKKFEKHEEKTIFVGYALGYITARDSWSYNFSRDKISYNMKKMIEEYNNQIADGTQIFDPTKISWDSSLTNHFLKKKTSKFLEDKIVTATYRPFVKQWFYSDKMMINTSSQSKFFTTRNENNLIICVSGIGVKKDFSCLMTNWMTDLEVVGKSQCFPLYWHDDVDDIRNKNKQISLFEYSNRITKRDGISDYALGLARKLYGMQITKEDVFYYVYGYLHAPEYKKTFVEDLKLSLPRIEFVKSAEDFMRFSQAGRELANLHLGYEEVEPIKSVKVSGDRSKTQVVKMTLIPDERKIIYNQHIVIENIPEEAFEYQVNGKSALKGLVDEYQYSVDKASGIVNDPNDYAGGDYILNLVLSVIAVSVKTMEIVRSLPKLEFDKKTDAD